MASLLTTTPQARSALCWFRRDLCDHDHAALPAKHIHAPWTLAPVLQHDLDVVVGRDYPHPVVDHDAARKVALALYSVSAPKGTP